MGSSLVHFHVRSDSAQEVEDALEALSLHAAWLSEPKSGWVSLWEYEASHQDELRIRAITHRLSDALQTAAIAFLVHDSDLLCYWLYDGGELADHFNSHPSYWGGIQSDDEQRSANASLLHSYCPQQTQVDDVQKLLWQRQHRPHSIEETDGIVMEEQRLVGLAEVLAIPQTHVMVDYGDLGREVDASEMGVRWIGLSAAPTRSVKESDLPSDVPDFDLETGGDFSTPLYQAVSANDLSALEQLIAQGVDLDDIPTGFTCTPVSMAASFGHSDLVHRLIAAGVDLTKRGREGATPLRSAVQAQQLDVIRLLVNGGADLGEEIPSMGNLLHVALQNPSIDLVRALVDLGVDTTSRNPAGRTPLESITVQLEGLKQIAAQMPGVGSNVFDNQLKEYEQIRKVLDGRSA